MATQEKTWNVANRLHSQKDSDNPEVNHIIAGADEIYDDAKGAKQSDINAQTDAALADRYTKAQVDSALNAKQDVLTFDNTPTAGSTNPVTSGGVKAAIDAVDVSSQIAVETERATNAETALGGRIDDVEDALETKADASDVEASLDTKQDTIADLATIRSGAALGATAKQPATTLAGYGITDAYTKAEVNNLVSTPHQQYVTVATKADLDAITIGSADTIYRVSNYDGTQVDATKYAEYAWDGTQYMLLSVKSAVGEVFDVSEYNSDATYETLAAALAAVPESVQRGGMSIKFVQSSDKKNKYVQYRLMADGWSTTETDWQGVDGEPTLNSNNLVESGGVERLIRYSTKSTSTSKDFAIGDENGNNVLEIYNGGELKTPKFDSKTSVKSTSTTKDFAIGDENGNNVLEIYNGGELKTPKFDSDKTIEIDDYDSISQLLISDGLSNVILSLRNGNLRTKFFNSKNKFSNFSILGDSYSTFRGYTHPTSNNQWYPALDVQSVEDTWWYKFALQYGIRLIANNSYSGSTICYDGYGDGSADAKETSFVTRSSNIGEIPELILIFGGTNDSWAGSGIGEYKYSDWTEEDLTTFRPAVAKMLHDVKYNNIGSTVIFILNTDLKSSIDESVETICDYYDVELLKLENISKSSNHPNKTGMTQICEQLITFINNLKF